MLWTDEDKARVLSEVPTSEGEAVTSAVVAEALGLPWVVVSGAMTSLYLGGDVEKIFAEPLGSGDSRYWKEG